MPNSLFTHWSKRSQIARWLLKERLISLVTQFGAAFGYCWLFVEATCHFFVRSCKDGWVDATTLMAFSMLYAVWVVRPKRAASEQIFGKDVFVNLEVRDIFDFTQGAVVIPTNTHFDNVLNGIIARENSVQSKFISTYFPDDIEYLEAEIKTSLDKQGYKAENVEDILTYPIGTVAEIRRNGKVFYLLAMSEINEHGRAFTTPTQIHDSLNGLWKYISEQGDNGSVVIPLIGTGKARLRAEASLSNDKEEAIRTITSTFIHAISKSRFCEKLTIAIYPADYQNGYIHTDNAFKFLHVICQYPDLAKC